MPADKTPTRVEPPVVLPKEAAPVEETPAGTDDTSRAGAAPVDDTEEPSLLNNPALEYPTAAYEAQLEGTAPRLRPGMEGVGKVSVGEERLIWIWTHGFTDWLRLALWNWMP